MYYKYIIIKWQTNADQVPTRWHWPKLVCWRCADSIELLHTQSPELQLHRWIHLPSDCTSLQLPEWWVSHVRFGKTSPGMPAGPKLTALDHTTTTTKFLKLKSYSIAFDWKYSITSSSTHMTVESYSWFCKTGWKNTEATKNNWSTHSDRQLTKRVQFIWWTTAAEPGIGIIDCFIWCSNFFPFLCALPEQLVFVSFNCELEGGRQKYLLAIPEWWMMNDSSTYSSTTAIVECSCWLNLSKFDFELSKHYTKHEHTADDIKLITRMMLTIISCLKPASTSASASQVWCLCWWQKSEHAATSKDWMVS